MFPSFFCFTACVEKYLLMSYLEYIFIIYYNFTNINIKLELKKLRKSRMEKWVRNLEFFGHLRNSLGKRVILFCEKLLYFIHC